MIKKPILRHVYSLGLWLVTGYVYADVNSGRETTSARSGNGPQVIYKGKKAQSIQKYFTRIEKAKRDNSRRTRTPKSRSKIVYGPAEADKYNNQHQLRTAARRLPVRTPSMQLGKVERRPMKLLYLNQPIFIIGSDPTSIRWLKKTQNKLKQIGAMGLLVQAETIEDLESVYEASGGLHIIPLSGESLANTHNLKHYPVLISKDGVKQ